MGLDWLACTKADRTSPLATLGMRRLNRDDPETIEKFKEIWQSRQDAIAKGEIHGNHRKHWGRPFETVLSELLAKGPDNAPFVETKATIVPDFCTGGSFACNQASSWRGKRLNYCGLPDSLANQAYQNMEPEQMLAYADQLEAEIPNLDPELEDGETLKDCQETVEEAVKWLRFWAGHGHSLKAWY
jgi:hypothetical protein